MMDIETRKEDTKEYFVKTSLDEVRKRAQNPEWRFSTRAMSAIVLAVADKYIDGLWAFYGNKQ